VIEIIPNWHPIFVHFPIAFVTAAVFFVAIGKFYRERIWAESSFVFGRWMLWAAAITACVAAVFGWMAYNSVKHDEAGHLAMTIHRNWALVSVFVLILLAVWAVRSWRSAAEPSLGLMMLLTAAWLLVASTAWHGGEVVYRHGLGVMSLPAPEAHEHEHGDSIQHDHDHENEGAANDEHAHDAAPESNIPAAGGATSQAKKPAHTHAPGTPPHKD